ncbi:50S ribosomal protein L4 [Bartonella sp. CB178]|uniref:50S ribosomal protein L4 n=1 Tax=Bartonella sp. CB178 TaxID=3112255 RepID=UPI00300DEC97
MDIIVRTLDGSEAGKVEVSESIFGLAPREDILQRVVRWQLARRQQGTHRSQGRSDVSRTGAKMFKQKGTGRARHSSARAPQFRGGGKAHGPVVRNHIHNLPKKVRALGLRLALSSKLKTGDLVVVENLSIKDFKTKTLVSSLSKFGFTNALVVGGKEIDVNFSRAALNIPNVDILPIQGINVYDILRRSKLVLSKTAVETLEERFQ